MADSIEIASESVANGGIQEQPAQEAVELTIENVAELGFDHELIRFAVFHTKGCIWEAADVLLRFESRPDKGNAMGLLEFALWVAEKDRIKALRILSRFRAGAATQSEKPKLISPKDSTEKSNAETAQKQSPLKKVTDGSKSRIETVETVQREPIIAKATDSCQTHSQSQNQAATIEMQGELVNAKATPAHQKENASSSGIKRKSPPDDVLVDVDAHDSSRRKTETSSINDKTIEVRLPTVNRAVNGGLNKEPWTDEKMRWADDLFQKSKSQLVFERGMLIPLPHKFDCLVRAFKKVTFLAGIRKKILEIETKAFPDPRRCILAIQEEINLGGIELKDMCIYCSMTHKWSVSYDEVVVLLILNRNPSRADLLRWVTKGKAFGKLCGNETCRRPSHIIGESVETARSRRLCQLRRRVALSGQIPPEKGPCQQHFPHCMKDLLALPFVKGFVREKGQRPIFSISSKQC